LQIGLAGANMYILGRVLRLRPPAALFSGVAYMFSGFLVVSVVFTMFIAAAAWLPLLLAIIEFIIRKQEEKGIESYSPIPYVAVGAVTLGLMILAGHPELIYYTLLVAGVYTLVRLFLAWRLIGRRASKASGAVASTLKLAAWLLAMALLGVAFGGAQLLPLMELLPHNFREGSASYEQVVGWAWPTRHLLTFFLPDFFGNPSHHHWFDIWSRQWAPAMVNARGETIDAIFWGIKNYVEGGNYLGILTWLLAAIALLAAFSRFTQCAARQAHVWFFALLALVSLLFAFGSPLYTLLFYGLPGWNQLHSPFRWVFPFTLSMAVLGGAGAQVLLEIKRIGDWRLEIGRWQLRLQSFISALSLLAIIAGVGALVVLLASLLASAPFIALGQRVVDGSDLAQMAFAHGRMFWSYQALNLAKFGLFALLSGLLVWWIIVNLKLKILSLTLLIVLDLYAAHGRFNPAADPELSPLNLANQPPVVAFINQREGITDDPQSKIQNLKFPWRFTTFNLPGEKSFNANVGIYYGWHDIRGYDSIILRQYVRLMERIAPQTNELLYNRIAPLYSNVTGETYAILDNPLLDLLNVKYILTEHYIPNPKWQEIYRDEAMGVYENRSVMARAFIAAEARVAPDEEQPLLETDLRRVVFLEETPVEEHALTPSLGGAHLQLAEARISRYTANDVFVDINLSDRGWLVLTDAYFPGWKAYLRPFGGNESQEKELRIYRANGAFRAVYLPQSGQWTVRFVYTPMSFKLGLYTSFLAVMTLLLLVFYWSWGRYYRPERTAGDARTVAKNSLVPMTLSLTNKAIDFAFAMLYVRLLGPEGTGKYAFVVAIYGFFEIISRYGLGTLLTRDVAADKHQSSRYLTNVIALRTLLWLASLPLLALVTLGYRLVGRVQFLDASGIGVQEVQAIALLAAAMLFANWADALSSMFYAFEKMEYPAGLANAAGLLKVTLGALVLLLGWGFVGLAGVSLAINLLQLFWLYGLLRSTLFRPEWRWDWSLQQWMLRSSGPLMLNHLLATIFWRIDVWILRPLAGAVNVGLYSVALKYLDGLNIVPSVFTMAIFPLMSRYARRDGDSLLRSYVISLRLLVMVSLPIAMMVTFIAEPLVWLVGGAAYLHVPDKATLFGREVSYLGGSTLALRVIIWSIPIGFINSVTQYVLIAVNQQRYLTKAFILGVVFNIVGNLLLIPGYGYIGAALVTILSEFSLLFPFYYSVKRNVGSVPWLSILASPLVSVALMGGALSALTNVGVNVWLGVAVGWLAYLGALVFTGAFRSEEMAVVRRVLPLRGRSVSTDA
jgi:O-antigen/teichoic acid export membrane protein